MGYFSLTLSPLTLFPHIAARPTAATSLAFQLLFYPRLSDTSKRHTLLRPRSRTRIRARERGKPREVAANAHDGQCGGHNRTRCETITVDGSVYSRAAVEPSLRVSRMRFERSTRRFDREHEHRPRFHHWQTSSHIGQTQARLPYRTNGHRKVVAPPAHDGAGYFGW